MLFPIRSETMVRRFPLVTVSLIALNFIVLFITYPIMLRDDKKINNAAEELQEFECKMYIKHLDEDKAVNFRAYALNREKMREKIKNREFGLTDEEWEEWNTKHQKLQDALESNIIKKLGFTPSEFNFLKLITSIFMHAGFGHLIGNMWFLWLVGCNIEDEWGRPIFLAFYIISGIVAALIFSIIAAPSGSLIGASGAIAGVMGAFAVLHHKSKIYFLFIWLLPPIFLTFPIYAGICLSFWFLNEIFQAFVFSEFSNVAFWAHVGGFGFGAIVVLVIKYYNLDERYLNPLVDNTLEYVDTSFAKAIEARSMGDIDTALVLLQENFEEDPSNQKIGEELIDIYCSNDRKKEAGSVAKECLRTLRKKTQDAKTLISFYEKEIDANGLHSYLSPYDFYFIADLYTRNHQFNKTSRVLASAYKNNRDSNDAPYILLRLIKALYKSKETKFLKKAIFELKRRFPDLEEEAKAIVERERNEPK